jgi:excisionase family DNA binding protein
MVYLIWRIAILSNTERSVVMERLLTPDQVAEFLAVSRKTVYRIIKAGKLEAVKVESILRIPEESLKDYVNRNIKRNSGITRKGCEYIFEVVIEPDEDVYHAYCPVLDGCHSSGDTETEAFRNIQEAVKLHLDVMIEDGKAIPGIGIVDSIDQLNLVFKLKELDSAL